MQRINAPLSVEAKARQAAATARANAEKATTINSLKAEVVRLADALDITLRLLDERD